MYQFARRSDRLNDCRQMSGERAFRHEIRRRRIRYSAKMVRFLSSTRKQIRSNHLGASKLKFRQARI